MPLPGGKYSMPPPAAGPPPAGPLSETAGAPQLSGGGSGRGGGRVAEKLPTPLEHRLRALPFFARNVGLVASLTHVWVG